VIDEDQEEDSFMFEDGTWQQSQPLRMMMMKVHYVSQNTHLNLVKVKFPLCLIN
jgi:hypothetical protein